MYPRASGTLDKFTQISSSPHCLQRRWMWWSIRPAWLIKADLCSCLCHSQNNLFSPEEVSPTWLQGFHLQKQSFQGTVPCLKSPCSFCVKGFFKEPFLCSIPFRSLLWASKIAKCNVVMSSSPTTFCAVSLCCQACPSPCI